jgi:hypothetical protein
MCACALPRKKFLVGKIKHSWLQNNRNRIKKDVKKLKKSELIVIANNKTVVSNEAKYVTALQERFGHIWRKNL